MARSRRDTPLISVRLMDSLTLRLGDDPPPRGRSWAPELGGSSRIKVRRCLPGTGIEAVKTDFLAGFNLLQVALEESSTMARDPEAENAAFIRQVYLHAIAYLLRALPPDLSSEEKLGIGSALPSGIVEPLQLDHAAGIQTQDPSHPPSMLHRTLAFTIFQLFILFQVVLPYIRCFFTAAVQYEHEHQVLKKTFSRGFEVVALLSRQALSYSNTPHDTKNGLVGKTVTEWSAWAVEGVVGGVCDGVGAGMGMMNARSSKEAERGDTRDRTVR